MDPFAIESRPMRVQRPASAWAPAVCSALIWGSGQLFNREKRKALIFLGGQITTVLYLNDFYHQYVLYRVMVSHFGQVLWTLAMIPAGLAALSLWAFNILDAWRMAQFLDAVAYRTITLEHDIPGWDFRPNSDHPKPPGIPFRTITWLLAALAVAHWAMRPAGPDVQILIASVEETPHDFGTRRKLIEFYLADKRTRQALLEAEDYLDNYQKQLNPGQVQWLKAVLAGRPLPPVPSVSESGSMGSDFVVEAVLQAPTEKWDQLYETLSPREFEEKALASLRRHPDQLRPLELLLHQYVDAQRWEDVQRLSREALRSQPQLPWLLEASALAESRLLRQTREAEALPDLNNAVLEKTLKSAIRAYRSGNLTEASDKIGEYFQKGGKEKEAWLLKNAVAFQKQDYPKAASTLEKALKIWPDDFLFQYSMGKAQYRMDHFREAAHWFESILKKDPNRTEVLKNLGLTYRKLNQIEESIAPLTQALEHEPTDDSIKLLLGLSLLETGKSDLALRHFRELTLKSPDHPLVDFYRGRAEEAQNLLTDALTSYRQVPRNSPVRTEALQRAKSLEEKLNQRQPRPVTPPPPTQVSPSPRLAQISRTASLLEEAEKAWQDERHAEAASLYQSILKEEPTHFRALSQLGRWEFEQQGSYERAKVYLDQALSLRPSDIWVNLSLGVIAKAMGSSYDAIRYFETVLKQEPTQLNANFNLALLYEDRGDLELAKQYYIQVIRHHPNNLLAYNYYGDICFNEGDFHRATELYSEVLKQAPSNTGIRFKLALSLEKERNYPAALSELEGLRAESGDEPMVREEIDSAIARVKSRM